MLYGILHIDVELWIKDVSFSTKTLACMCVVLPALSHVLILIWVGYRIAVCVGHHISDIGRVLVVSKKTVLHLFRRHGYEELRDSLAHT